MTDYLDVLKFKEEIDYFDNTLFLHFHILKIVTLIYCRQQIFRKYLLFNLRCAEIYKNNDYLDNISTLYFFFNFIDVAWIF